MLDARLLSRRRLLGGTAGLLGVAVAIRQTTDGTARESGPPLDRSRLEPSFTEAFATPPSLYDPHTRTGRWKTNFDFGRQDGPYSRSLGGELQIYSDPAYNGVNPFAWKPGQLAITAARNPNPGGYLSANRPYTSGLLTTAKSFQQLYGYFEMQAVLPQGAGLWPAFWMGVDVDQRITAPQYPGEIDVMEQLGRDPTTVYCSAHWPTNARNTQKADKTIDVAVGDTAVPRRYGVAWTAADLIWYVDDQPVARIANPGLHRPMLLLVNLTVGGSWGGPPTAATTFPARLLVSSIRAYRSVS